MKEGSVVEYPKHWPHLRTTNPIESNLRDGAAENNEDTRLCLARWHPSHGLQVDEECRAAVAQTERCRAPGPSELVSAT